jgi:Uma2 family endonuclease
MVIRRGDSYIDIDQKLSELLNAGTSLVWIVNPFLPSVMAWDGHGRGHRISAGEEVSAAPEFPDLIVPVAELIQRAKSANKHGK